MTTLEQIRDVVRRTWGHDGLRPLQVEAIQAGVAGRDSLVVLPTGGGKSLCYQVPPLVTGRTDLVISPLIALMKDQVDGLVANGYAAAALHSHVSPAEQREVEAKLMAGELRLLFVAPERLVFVNSFSDKDGGLIRHPMSATWPLEIHNTLTLTELDGKTTLTLYGGPVNATEAERQTYAAGRSGLQQGMAGSFAQLDAYLETLK
jgi:uncharacterized protein YndB with AHSA1/START domain